MTNTTGWAFFFISDISAYRKCEKTEYRKTIVFEWYERTIVVPVVASTKPVAANDKVEEKKYSDNLPRGYLVAAGMFQIHPKKYLRH